MGDIFPNRRGKMATVARNDCCDQSPQTRVMLPVNGGWRWPGGGERGAKGTNLIWPPSSPGFVIYFPPILFAYSLYIFTITELSPDLSDLFPRLVLKSPSCNEFSYLVSAALELKIRQGVSTRIVSRIEGKRTYRITKKNNACKKGNQRIRLVILVNTFY